MVNFVSVCLQPHIFEEGHTNFGREELKDGESGIDNCCMCEEFCDEGAVSIFWSFFVASMPPTKVTLGIEWVIFG